MSKQNTDGEQTRKTIAVNRKARQKFSVVERFEAGLVLTGTEVKSLRQGNCSLDESFARPRGTELFILGMHIAPYEQGNRENHDPKRPRKLLLHKREMRRLIETVEQKGLTLIPLSLYFKSGLAKVELALARGKSLYDRREDMKQQDARREVDREMRKRRGK